MKKLIKRLFLFILVVCSFCSKGEALKFSKVKIGDVVGKGFNYNYHLHDHLSSTFIYKDKQNNNYIVAASSPDDMHNVTSIAVFSPERKLLESEKIKWFTYEDIQHFKGRSLKEIKAKYGNPHCDIGSSQCVPAYVGKDATLICLLGDGFYNNDDNIVEDIVYWDIINKKYVSQRPFVSQITPVKDEPNVFQKLFIWITSSRTPSHPTTDTSRPYVPLESN